MTVDSLSYCYGLHCCPPGLTGPVGPLVTNEGALRKGILGREATSVNVWKREGEEKGTVRRWGHMTPAQGPGCMGTEESEAGGSGHTLR